MCPKSKVRKKEYQWLQKWLCVVSDKTVASSASSADSPPGCRSDHMVTAIFGSSQSLPIFICQMSSGPHGSIFVFIL